MIKKLTLLLLLVLAPIATQASNQYDDLINQHATRTGLPVEIIKAVIAVESDFKPKAKSHKGAKGLMQLMPDTAKRFGVKNAYSPEQNIRAGTTYLRWLFDRFRGDWRLALAGYNAGEGNVDKYNGIPPFTETQNYVRKVLAARHKYAPPTEIHEDYKLSLPEESKQSSPLPLSYQQFAAALSAPITVSWIVTEQ